jgi:hypothetical protein
MEWSQQWASHLHLQHALLIIRAFLMPNKERTDKERTDKESTDKERTDKDRTDKERTDKE